MVEVPSGVIANEGIRQIVTLLTDCDALKGKVDSWDIRNLVDSVDSQWQTKEGNYTKRLARTFYKTRSVKIPNEIVSLIGCIANDHTEKTNSFHIELTRDLNQSASAFGHADSCWFTSGSYGKSRCALKTNGGMGIRSYGNEDSSSDYPEGRAWVLPLNSDMSPTADAIGATSFLVFNGYGNMSGYAAPRIIAHLSGMTYRKVSVNAEIANDYDANFYVNGDVGYLVSDEATCKANDSVTLSLDLH